MRRAAVSLVETLVVLAIVGLLAALLLPSVQRVRDAAARARSLNNLRQLALAAHDFHAARNRLPGTGDPRFDAPDVGPVPVFFFDLLPYLDGDAVYREFSVSGGRIVPPAVGGPRAVLPACVSPSDPTNPRRTAANGWGSASYRPNGGVLGDNWGLLNVTDGTSNTLLLGERLMQCHGDPLFDPQGDFPDLPNTWFGPDPRFFVFGKTPKQSNFGPPADRCDPEYISTPSPFYTVVAMADGSTRSVSAAAAVDNWVIAAGPQDGDAARPSW